MMSGVTLVNANGIPIGIEDEGHAADGRGERLHLERDAGRLQVRDGRLEVLDFQADGAAVRAWMPVGRTGPGGERAVGDVVFGPLHPCGFADQHRGLQVQHAFIKLPRLRHVGDGVTGEGDFGDLEHIILTANRVPS